MALPPLDGEPELVTHRDYCPGNVVFRDGLPAALIDFDLAQPTTRLYDIANALWWWAPLRDPQDRAPAFTALDIPRRAAVFADAYGMTGQQRQGLVPLTIRMARRYQLTARAAAGADPVFRRIHPSALPGGAGVEISATLMDAPGRGLGVVVMHLVRTSQQCTGN